MLSIHIYPSLKPEKLALHVADRDCPCQPRNVVAKQKRFVFHQDTPNRTPTTQYDPAGYADLPDSYKSLIESYIEKFSKNRPWPVKKKPVPKKPKRKSEPGISRIDSGNTHGWFVRVYKKGRTYSKLFSDGKCGGKERALEFAREYRDTLRRKLGWQPTRSAATGMSGIPRPSKKKYAKIRRKGRYAVQRVMHKYSKSKTGIVGVYRNRDRGGNEYYYVNYNVGPEKRRTKCFSITKYGDEKAFELACQVRQAYLEKKVFEEGESSK